MQQVSEPESERICHRLLWTRPASSPSYSHGIPELILLFPRGLNKRLMLSMLYWPSVVAFCRITARQTDSRWTWVHSTFSRRQRTRQPTATWLKNQDDFFSNKCCRLETVCQGNRISHNSKFKPAKKQIQCIIRNHVTLPNESTGTVRTLSKCKHFGGKYVSAQGFVNN